MMPVPPLPVRRIVIAPGVVLAEVALLVASPLLAILAALASPVFGGWRPVRMLVIAVVYAYRHLGATLACLGLWLTRRGRHEAAHYRVMRWFVSGIHDAIVRIAHVEVRTVESGDAERLLSARDRPVLVLSVHAGEGDSLLVLHRLLCRHGRRPRIVMHEALRLDPVIDVLGERLHNRFVDPRGGDTEVEIAAMSRDVADDDAVLIFPEGGNTTAEHRRRGIERLERAGHHEEAAWARAMRHLSAPRPGGTLAAIEASPPAADVIFMAHSGFPSTLKDVWRQLPHRQTVATRLWHEPGAAVPEDRDERIDWLFGWWRTLDDWVESKAESRETPVRSRSPDTRG